MKISERKRFNKKTPKQKARIRRRKLRREQSRQDRESQMAAYLLENGWTQSGPNGDVWKADHWKPQKYIAGYDRRYVMNQQEWPDVIRAVYVRREPKHWESEDARMTLSQAYKNQLRLDAMGFVRPKTIDDDLADLI